MASVQEENCKITGSSGFIIFSFYFFLQTQSCFEEEEGMTFVWEDRPMLLSMRIHFIPFPVQLPTQTLNPSQDKFQALVTMNSTTL